MAKLETAVEKEPHRMTVPTMDLLPDIPVSWFEMTPDEVAVEVDLQYSDQYEKCMICRFCSVEKELADALFQLTVGGLLLELSCSCD